MIYLYRRIPYCSENEWTRVTCSNINKEHYDELQKQVKEEGKVVMISSTESSNTHNTKEHTA